MATTIPTDEIAERIGELLSRASPRGRRDPGARRPDPGRDHVRRGGVANSPSDRDLPREDLDMQRTQTTEAPMAEEPG